MNKFVTEFEQFLERVRTDYPELRFVGGRKFMYRPPRTVVVEQKLLRPAKMAQNAEKGSEVGVEAFEQENYLQLLHEIGHALLGHCDYRTDPERLKMERAAWDKAQELCSIYDIHYDEEFVEAELDTYRDWLYRRSRCPECGATRYQTGDGKYHCLECDVMM